MRCKSFYLRQPIFLMNALAVQKDDKGDLVFMLFHVWKEKVGTKIQMAIKICKLNIYYQSNV